MTKIIAHLGSVNLKLKFQIPPPFFQISPVFWSRCNFPTTTTSQRNGMEKTNKDTEFKTYTGSNNQNTVERTRQQEDINTSDSN